MLLTRPPYQWWQLPFVMEGWVPRFGITQSGGRVSLWAGRKGFAAFAQASGANQPSWDGTQLTFDGSAHVMQTENFTLNQAATVVAAMEPDAYNTGTTQVFIGGKQAVTGFLYNPTGGSNLAVYAGSQAAAAAGPAIGSYYIFSGTLNGASSGWGYNRNAINTGDAGAANPGGLTIGANSSGAAEFAACKFKSIALCGAMTAAQLAQLINALNSYERVF